MLAPVLDDVKRRVGDRATIFKLDVDRNPLVASTYNVMAVPTLIIFQNGKPLWRRSGVLWGSVSPDVCFPQLIDHPPSPYNGLHPYF